MPHSPLRSLWGFSIHVQHALQVLWRAVMPPARDFFVRHNRVTPSLTHRSFQKNQISHCGLQRTILSREEEMLAWRIKSDCLGMRSSRACPIYQEHFSLRLILRRSNSFRRSPFSLGIIQLLLGFSFSFALSFYIQIVDRFGAKCTMGLFFSPSKLSN
jgi:hypothetical protein